MIKQSIKLFPKSLPGGKLFARIFLTGMIIMLFSSSSVYAKEVTVKGYGENQDQAVRDALRMAVEQAVGVLIDSSTLTQNYAVVKDEIYSKSQGFVRDYNIIGQERQGGQVVVTVKAVVDTEPNSKLYTELQRLKLIDMLRDPRIAVIIPESYVSARIPDPAGETAIIKKLTDAGFRRIVDPQRVTNIRNSNTIKALLQGNRQEVTAVATNLGVDYLIVGEAFSQFAGNVLNSGVISCRARLEARVIKADTAEIITAHGVEASGVDITEFIAAKKSLNNAGEKMGDYLVEKIMALASNPEKGVQLIVRNIPSFNKVSILEDQLRQVRGVNNVFIRDYSGGRVVIDLNYTGSPQSLANALGKFNNINLIVEEISHSVINAVVNY